MKTRNGFKKFIEKEGLQSHEEKIVDFYTTYIADYPYAFSDGVFYGKIESKLQLAELYAHFRNTHISALQFFENKNRKSSINDYRKLYYR